MYPFRYEVSLRFRHPSLDPDDICRKLGMETKTKWKAGAARKTPTGIPLKGVYETTFCSFRLEHSKNIGLADFLKRCNHKLNKYKEFFDSIRSSGGNLEYFIGWFADKDSGETFDLELLQQVAELGIDLALCVYPIRAIKLSSIKPF